MSVDSRQSTLDWNNVLKIDWHRQRILVRDLGLARAAPPETLTRTVLAQRDLEDALILDVVHTEALRANDLWFREEHEHLWLAAATVAAGRFFVAGAGGRSSS